MLQQFLEKDGYLSIPFQYNTVGHLVLDVEMNDIPAKFILDTGASKSVVDYHFAIENAIAIASKSSKGSGLGGTKLPLYKGVISKFRINMFERTDFEIIFIDLNNVIEAYREKGISDGVHGVLGADFLKKLKAIISYSEAILYIKEG